MSLKDQVYQLIEDTIRLCNKCYEAEALKNGLVEMKARLDAPLRVAVAGVMKAGKSTFMNALIGDNLVYTGNLETTYTVCWFKYAEKPFITVCFRNGETQKEKFENLARWSVRSYEEENPRINDVKYLIVHYPSEILKKIEFIDTPGLNSSYGTDAQNTLDFLEIQGSEDTIRETSMADAIIYAFSRDVGEFDEKLLRAFQQGGSYISSPINSVGILTKPDVTGAWHIGGDMTPIQAAASVAENIMKSDKMKRLVYATLPVCAKAVEGLAALSEDDWLVLDRLLAIPRNEVIDILFDAGNFANSSDSLFTEYGDVKTRSHLMDSLGQYGILEVYDQRSIGITRDKIRGIVSERCGITDVRKMLLSHFGNRTFLIKSQFIFNNLKALSRRLRLTHRNNRQLINICEELENQIDELMMGVQTLNELRILQYYYNGQLKFLDKDELEDFMQITGEYGREPEKRLGVNSSISMRELMIIAKKKTEKWHEKASSFMMQSAYVDAAATIARSYEYIYYHLSALCDE